MSHLHRLALLVLTLAMLGLAPAGCGVLPSEPTPTPPPTPTPDLPPADEAAFAFLQAWQRGDYAAMYSLLSPASRQIHPEDRFAATYRQVVEEAGIQRVTPQIRAAYQPGDLAEVSFDVSFETALVGPFQVQNKMGLSYADGRWGVDWSPALILPQLSEDASVLLTVWAPSRGNIYDRNGRGLAVQGERVEVGVIPGKIEDTAAVLELLSAVLGQPTVAIQERYAAAPGDWYVPLGEISTESAQASFEALSAAAGVELRRSWTRSYNPDIIAPHIVGVVGPILEGEVEQWKARGYQGDEVVGRMGLERWGEPYLAGQRGGRLQIVTDKGETVAVLAERQARENSSLYTTFDRDFQKKVQDILGERQGAIAVLEAQTGRVLALATYPNFDPNLFPTGISAQAWQQLQADPSRPLVNRSAQGTYPAGSMFKPVTMTAGMEEGGLTGQSTFTCRGTWTGLGPRWPKTCWLRSGHGRIALGKALTVSCDITFYEVGMLLDGLDSNLLPEYARKCGLGAATGIEIEEEAGLVPDPAWKLQTKGEGWSPGDTVNLAIGQSELQVTPLQAAVLYAALGNGGTLYRPQTVEMIAADPNSPDSTFAPQAVGQLPISPENLKVIQESLHNVTANSAGTAYRAFLGLSMAVAGKTGTAESGQALPHAWFAGWAPAENPEIAIAVIVEHSGEGSVYSAPLFRKVVEAYFKIEPTPTPGPTPTATPKP
jgi:penicillin-binding protein 2